MPITHWLLYADHEVDPICRSLTDGRKSGHTYSQPDLIIAASALHYGLTVVSRDTSEYARAGVQVFNPWQDALPGDIGTS